MGDLPAFFSSPLYSDPVLKIVRQPQKRGYRFRYSSEGLTHGGIRGELKPGEKEGQGRFYPTVKLCGHRGGRAKVVVTIVTANEPAHLHAHSLIANKEKTKGYHVYSMDGRDPVLELSTIAIQHVVKEKVKDTLMDRILQTHFLQKVGWSSSIADFDAQKFADLTAYTDALKDREEGGSFTNRETKTIIGGEELVGLERRALELQKTMDMNKCRLSFQVFLQDSDGHFSRRLPPLYSDVIFDGKTKHGAALKIMRISKVTSSVNGDEEVWLIADRLHADDLEVRFFEEPTPGKCSNGWEGFGKFQKTDVLKQICLIFRTPEYHDKNIEQPVSVSMQLRRISDRDCVSEPPQVFKYTPIRDRYGIGAKRKKELPMKEILDFSQGVKKRPVQPAAFPPVSANNNMTFNFPSLLSMMTANQQLNPNMLMNFMPNVVTSSAFSNPVLNFGNSTNLTNCTAVNSSGINFPATSTLSSRAVHETVVDSSSTVKTDPGANTPTNPDIKKEGDESHVMDCNGTESKIQGNNNTAGTSENNGNNLSMFITLDGGHSESMVNFLNSSFLDQTGDYFE